MNFELVPGTFFSQSSRSFTGADRLRRLEQMVGKDFGMNGKVGPNARLVENRMLKRQMECTF